MISKEVFRAYDIRGQYPNEINEEFAYRLGRAFVDFLRTKKDPHGGRILVNRDTRASSKSLAESLIRGITEGGVGAFDGGVSTSPMHYFGVGTYDVDGGIMVTASHSGAGSNGFKLSTKTERIAENNGLSNIHKIMEGEFTPGKLGAVQNLDYIDAYANYLKKFSIASKFAPLPHVVVDASGGSAAAVLEKILPLLPIKAEKIFFDIDPLFSSHNPNPLLPESQKMIREKLWSEHYDFGAIFDADGDRVIFFDGSGRMIPSDYIAALIAEDKLLQKPEGKVLFDISSSKKSREYIEKKGGVVEVVRVGTAFFRNALEKDTTILLGAESSGHYYYPELFNNDGAALTLIYVLNAVAKREKSLEECIEPLRAYYRSGELNFTVPDKKKTLQRVKENFPDGKVLLIDGITIEFKDWWFNIRPSNTDPVLRLHIEANTEELMNEKKALLEGLIKKE